jgi:hypothetical protein
MYRKQLVSLTAALLLGATLAGCGASTVPSAAARNAGTLAARSAAESPDRVAPPKVDLPAEEATAESKKQALGDGYVAENARRTATDALYRYQDLLREWDHAWSDREKDRIEQRMLEVMTRAIKDIERSTSGAFGYEERRINDVARSVIDRYRELLRRYDNAYSDRERREIVNQMLTELTRGLKQVQR